MKRKLFVVATLLLLMICSLAVADTSGDWTYTVSGTEATITAYGGNDVNVVIPSTLDGYTVKQIGTRAFRNNTAITSVEIPSGVTSIGTQAFQGCSALEEVIIPDTVEGILGQAFAGTALTQVQIPANASNIMGNAFPSSALLLIDEYDSLALASVDGVYQYIEYEAVDGGVKLYTYSSSEDAITVPETILGQPVVEIDTSGSHLVFPNNNKLIVDMVGQVAELLSDNGYILYDVSDLTMGLRKSGGMVYLSEYDGTAASVTVPASVQVIDINVFKNKSTITEVILPNGLTEISSGAFQGTGLTSIVLPDTLVSIDSSAFDAGVKMIASLNGSVSQLLSDNGYIFYDATDLTMGLRKYSSTDDSGNPVQEIILAEYVGSDTSVTIPNYVNRVGSYAFNGNSTIQQITVPASVTSFDEHAFYGASALTDVYLPDGMNSLDGNVLEYGLMYYCEKNSDTARALGSCGYNFADPAEPDFLLRWYDTRLRLIAYLGNDVNVTVPGDVQEIGDNVFKNNKTVESVILPGSITAIHAGAFLNATGIRSIDLPANLTRIETLAFYNTGIKDIVIPDGVTTIRGGEAPANLESTYYSDGYDYPSLPVNCMVHATLGSTASRALSNLGYTVYKPNDTIYGCRYIDNLLYLVRYNGQEDVITVPEGTEGVAYVFGAYNKMTGVVFPSTLKVIGYEAFKNCSGLTSITIPTTVEEIGYEAFAGSALRSIRLPDNVQKVGYGAFRDCTNLAAVTFVVSGQSGLSVIGSYAFYNTGLRSVTIPTTTTSIGEYAFAGNGENQSKLATVTLPANGSLTQVGSYAFHYTAITSLTIPGTVQTIDSYAFAGCYSLQNATLDAGVRDIGYGAFQSDNNLQTVTLNSGVKTIGDYAFYDCSQLNSITIPNGVTSIGEWAFYYNSALKSIALPNTVTSVGEYAFYCADLSECITLSSGMTTIKPYTFQNSSLRSIVIPNSVTSIGTYAFEGCYSLTEITLSNKLRTIESGAFDNCSSLVWFELPNTMTSLNQCLDNCTSAIVVLPDSITYIQGIAFDDVRAVLGSRNNVILKSLDRFGYSDERTFIYTYINEDGLEDYNFLRVVGYIGDAIEVVLPSDVNVINDGAFLKCIQMKKLILPDTGISSIGTNVFHDGLQVICTTGSATHQLLVDGGYRVEVNGYPGLYAVARSDGKLYDAAYYGNASIIDLPDNIASTQPYGEEYGEYYDEATGSYHPMRFPFTTRYRTTFDSLTAQTLGSNGYYITVAGYEDFGFRHNAYEEYGSDMYADPYGGNVLAPYNTSDDTWFVDKYYGTETDLILPDAFEYIGISNFTMLNSITLGAHVKEIGGYPPTNLKIFIDPEHFSELDMDNYFSGYTFQYGFYALGYPDFELCFDRGMTYYYDELVLRRYVGQSTEVEVDGNEPFRYVLPDAFGTARIYCKGYPDIDLTYSDTFGRVISGYRGTAKEVFLGEDLANVVDDISESAFPADVTILAYPDSAVVRKAYFNTHPFRAAEDHDFEYQYIYPAEDEPGLIHYYGNKNEITLPAGTYGISSGVFPTSVKRIHLDHWVPSDYLFVQSRNELMSIEVKLIAEIDSEFVNRVKQFDDWYGLYTTAYPDVRYNIEYSSMDRQICLDAYTGSDSVVKLPGYYTAFTHDIDMQSCGYYDDYGQWHDYSATDPFNPFGKPIYVYPNTATANLLDAYYIPYNVRQTVKSTLPAAMTTIEEEAFMNSSFEEVTIGSKCTTIGARAFADSNELVIIHIPRNVRIIDDTAFAGCSQLTIYCKTGSVAETFASNHGIPYVNE